MEWLHPWMIWVIVVGMPVAAGLFEMWLSEKDIARATGAA